LLDTIPNAIERGRVAHSERQELTELRSRYAPLTRARVTARSSLIH
jgi:hypothetical protein